ncbi:Multidrug and toxin extrusion protein 1 [Mizuhopecten yessoensis]|uniref:Multidrug and toxin extrusion protein n=2 Tax=Mizuhopecten yessoensis TaxID=6573 RepID=A0A210PYV3_MIZYE|nr:Multidrug and toxin extrusion protein 1 [Mizuhopecten yessoensis]
MDEDQNTEGCTKWTHRLCRDGFKGELMSQLKIVWPVVVTQLLQYLVLLVSLIFCGHLGKETLDGVALASTLINVTGNSVMMGLGSACDTLFSQTFGSSNKFRVGNILQRSLIIMLLCSLPCCAILMNTEHLLILLGQNPFVARLGGKYAIVYIAALPGQIIAIILAKYLQAQSIVMPSLVIAFVSNVINCGLHALFISGLHFGIMGAALSVALTQWTIVLFHLIYILTKGRHKATWDGWTLESFNEWGKFFSLALPGLFMVCLEWWTFEILFFIVGTLGVVPLASHTIAYNAAALAFMIPLGLSVAASVRIGNHLGANEPSKAATATRVAVILAFIFAVAVGLLTLAVNGVLPLFFTSDPSVIKLASKLLMVSALFELFNCAQGALCGIIRGLGYQIFGALTNFISYYIVALPLCIPMLLLTNMGVYGAWWGVIVSSALQTFIYFVRILRTDWKKEAENAQIRAGLVDKEGAVSSGDSSIVLMSELHGSKTRLIDDESLTTRGTQCYGVLSNHECISPPGEKQDYSAMSNSDIPNQQPKVADKNDDYHKLPNSSPSWKRTLTYRVILVSVLVAILVAGIVIKLHFDQFGDTDEKLCSDNNSINCVPGDLDFLNLDEIKNELFGKNHPQTFG